MNEQGIDDAKERPHSAAHEAGHGVAAYLCGLNVNRVWVGSGVDLGQTDANRPDKWAPCNLPALLVQEQVRVHRLIMLRHLAGKAAQTWYSRHIDPTYVAEGDDDDDVNQARKEATQAAKLPNTDPDALLATMKDRTHKFVQEPRVQSLILAVTGALIEKDELKAWEFKKVIEAVPKQQWVDEFDEVADEFR